MRPVHVAHHLLDVCAWVEEAKVVGSGNERVPGEEETSAHEEEH